MKERFRQLRMGFNHTLAFVGDIVILNLLFLICSIPIVTIGAAATACYAGVSRTLQKRETGLVFKAFFADFRAAFRQLVTYVKIACVAIAGFMIGNTMLLNVRNSPAPSMRAEATMSRFSDGSIYCRMKNTVIGAAIAGKISAKRLFVNPIRYMNW